VLLNSDTLVAPGWLEDLRAVAYSAPDIGTATPLSNDATILS
jgi:GT2 family glycosyltransferase